MSYDRQPEKLHVECLDNGERIYFGDEKVILPPGSAPKSAGVHDEPGEPMQISRQQQEDCACLQGDTDDFDARPLGVDHDFGEATVLRCRRCSRYWLHYLVEYEYLTAAGRWFRGVITPETAASAEATSAKKI